ncbi:PepSY domain-containing protein [Methylobacterium oxalidis]|uniref:PepSY domain-containing protein n=1 Tax=Methylobacterium oxalidis TaxID=944322 RepID=UPI003314CD82
MSVPIRLAILSSLCVGALMMPALADRAPNAEERAAIEKKLQAEGYTAWESIELEDSGVWEVDDAVAKDGKKYDLRLKSGTYEITNRLAD